MWLLGADAAAVPVAATLTFVDQRVAYSTALLDHTAWTPGWRVLVSTKSPLRRHPLADMMHLHMYAEQSKSPGKLYQTHI